MSGNAHFISKGRINQTLRIKPKQGKRLLEPFKSFAEKNLLPFKIIEDTKIICEPEMHMKDGDLFYCIEGKGTFICGGYLTNKVKRINVNGSPNDNEYAGNKIKNGVKYRFKPGDWLWIPPGVPHQHGTSTMCRMVIIKVPVPDLSSA